MINLTSTVNFLALTMLMMGFASETRAALPGLDYTGPKTITPYFSEIVFTEYPPATEFILTAEQMQAMTNSTRFSVRKVFGCTGGVTNGLVGRNFDWPFESTDEYLIRTTADPDDKRHATIGISAPGILSDVCKELGEDIYAALIPLITVDGVNDAGVHISDYVVPSGDMGVTTGTNPTASESVYQAAFVRHALDYAGSVEEVVGLATNLNLKAIDGLDLELHLLVADTRTNCVIECISNKVVVLWGVDKITNFYLDYAAKHPAQPYTPCSMGIERYRDFAAGFASATSEAAMADLLKTVYYTRSYRTGRERDGWSDVNGEENAYYADYGGLSPKSFSYGDDGETYPCADLARLRTIRAEGDAFNAGWERFVRTGTIAPGDGDITSHAAVYDLAHKTLVVRFLEREVPFRFALNEDAFVRQTGLYVNDDAVGVATNCAIAGGRWTYDGTTRTLNLLDAGDYRVEGPTNGFTIAGVGTPRFAGWGNERYPWTVGKDEEDSVIAWTNGTGKLVFGGEGEMRDFAADGADRPWQADAVNAVEIGSKVTSVGRNAWVGNEETVTYNGLSAAAAKTLLAGFGNQQTYARTSFTEVQVTNGIVSLTAVLETAPSLTNEWTQVELKDGDVGIRNGSIVIEHNVGTQAQGFYNIR